MFNFERHHVRIKAQGYNLIQPTFLAAFLLLIQLLRVHPVEAASLLPHFLLHFV